MVNSRIYPFAPKVGTKKVRENFHWQSFLSKGILKKHADNFVDVRRSALTCFQCQLCKSDRTQCQTLRLYRTAFIVFYFSDH